MPQALQPYALCPKTFNPMPQALAFHRRRHYFPSSDQAVQTSWASGVSHTDGIAELLELECNHGPSLSSLHAQTPYLRRTWKFRGLVGLEAIVGPILCQWGLRPFLRLSAGVGLHIHGGRAAAGQQHHSHGAAPAHAARVQVLVRVPQNRSPNSRASVKSILKGTPQLGRIVYMNHRA